jgi:uncharacterized repeat protein (TIGR01451 family)
MRVSAFVCTNRGEGSLVPVAHRSTLSAQSRALVLLAGALLLLLLLGSTIASNAWATAPGEAEVMASSPAPLTSLALDPTTNVIYALEFEGKKAYSYDANTNVWTELPEAPINIGNNGGAAYLDGRIYSSSTSNSSTVEVYEVASGTWSTIANPLGEGTANITAVGGELYMVDATKFVKYNPTTEATTTLADAPAFNGSGFEPWGGLQPYGGKIYGDQGDGSRGFAVYDIASNTWTELPEVPEGTVAGSALDPTTGTYYAYGNYGGDSLFEYDIATESWTTFTLPFNVNDGGLVYVALPGVQGIYAIQGQEGSQFVRYVTVDPSADLSTTDTAGTSTAKIGEELTYTMQVTNHGPSSATNAELSVALPSNVSLLAATSSQGSCSGTATVLCRLGTIFDEGTATVTIVVKATAGGAAASTATVSSETSDPLAANNSATADITVEGPASASQAVNTAVSTPTTTATAPVRCTSARSETIHWKTLEGVRLKRVIITVNGTEYAKLAGGARSAKVSLVGRTAGTVVVAIAGRTKAGRLYANERVYHPCEAQAGSGSAPSLYLTRQRAYVH